MCLKKTNELTVSIVIPTLNRSDHLGNALKSILQQSMLSKEVIVVDQSDNSNTKTLVGDNVQVFSQKGIRLKYIWESTKSITHARNVGAFSALGNIVLFMDDDMIAQKHYVREILKVFSNNSEAAGVQGSLFPPAYWEGSSVKTKLVNIFRKAFLLTHLEKDKQRVLLSGDAAVAYPSTKIIRAQLIYPAMSAFKREVLQKFPLDEKLTGYSWQEEYFTLKLSQAYPNCLFVTPFATIFHNTALHGRPMGKRFYYVNAVYELYNFETNLHPSFKNWIAFFWKWLGRTLIAAPDLRSKTLRMRFIYIFGSYFWALNNLEDVRAASIK